MKGLFVMFNDFEERDGYIYLFCMDNNTHLRNKGRVKKKGYRRVRIDVDCLPIVRGYRWIISKDGYVVARSGNSVRMHRLLCEPRPKKHEFVDHIDGNKKNNSRSNLRVVNNMKNIRNYRLDTNRLDIPIPVKGVGYEDGKWYAVMHRLGWVERLGEFDSIFDAILARIRHEYIHYGVHSRCYRQFVNKYMPLDKLMYWFPEIYSLDNLKYMDYIIHQCHLRGRKTTREYLGIYRGWFKLEGGEGNGAETLYKY